MKNIDKEELFDLYINKGFSTRDIAKVFNCGQTTIIRHLKKNQIEARKNAERTQYFSDKMKPIYERFSELYSKNRHNICQYCGNEFDVNYKNKNKKYCSEECLSNSKKKNLIQFCETCGKEIENINNKCYKRKYCKECNVPNRAKSQMKRISVKCGYCKAELQIIQSRKNKNKYNYCDKKCMALHYAQIYTGKNSPTWNGGKRHYDGNWLKSRNIARERDNYTCQICGINENEMDKELDVHHIKPYKKYKNKKCANKLKNLVSLCHNCHRFIHSKRNTNKIYIKK